MGVQLKRVYDAPSPDDGYRVLVDRLWPRGVRKDSLVLDQWDKQVAPSAELRRAYHHHVLDDAQFRERYLATGASGFSHAASSALSFDGVLKAMGI